MRNAISISTRATKTWWANKHKTQIETKDKIILLIRTIYWNRSDALLSLSLARSLHLTYFRLFLAYTFWIPNKVWNVNEVNYCDLIPSQQNIKYFISTTVSKTVHVNGLWRNPKWLLIPKRFRKCTACETNERSRKKRNYISSTVTMYYYYAGECAYVLYSVHVLSLMRRWRSNIQMIRNWFSEDLTFWDWKRWCKFITGYLWFLFLFSFWMQMCNQKG